MHDSSAQTVPFSLANLRSHLPPPVLLSPLLPRTYRSLACFILPSRFLLLSLARIFHSILHTFQSVIFLFAPSLSFPLRMLFERWRASPSPRTRMQIFAGDLASTLLSAPQESQSRDHPQTQAAALVNSNPSRVRMFLCCAVHRAVEQPAFFPPSAIL
jgi:hypothetical protein